MSDPIAKGLRDLARAIERAAEGSGCYSVAHVAVAACASHVSSMAGSVEKNQRIHELERELTEARKVEGLALAQVKETTAVLDLVSLERNELRAELAKLRARLNDLHDVPPEHESEPMPFHRGWELAVRAVAANG